MKKRRTMLWMLLLFYCCAAALCVCLRTISPGRTCADTALPTAVTDAPSNTTPALETESIPEETAEAGDSENDRLPAAPSPETTFVPVPFVCQTRFLPLRIRYTPYLTGQVIGRILPGEEGIITGIVDEEWVCILFHEIFVYCDARYLDYSLSQSPAGTAQQTSADIDTERAPTPPPEQQAAYDMVHIIQGCYIRRQPDWRDAGTIIKAAQADACYPHAAQKDTPNFYAIQLPDRTIAYVSADYAEVVNERP